MIQIDRLRLYLPSQMRPHAELIARSVGEALAAAEIQKVGRIERCSIAPTRIDASSAPEEVADIASRGILKQLRRRQS